MSHPNRPESRREERDRPQPHPDRDRDIERKDFPGKRADEGERPEPGEKVEPETPWPHR
jgi:hypothetical protein